jgi:hypothetical protein
VTVNPCWICQQPAATREHSTKKTDLAAALPKPSQAKPIYFSDGRVKNVPLGSFKSDYLRFKTPICADCNNARTQPYDRAWDTLSAGLRARAPNLKNGDSVRCNRIFRYAARKHLLNVHLYFVKLFGCYIVDANAHINVESFAHAILKAKAHPQVLLRFGISTLPVGRSDFDVDYDEGGNAVYAGWFQTGGGIGVHLVYAANGQHRQGMIDTWHPSQATTRLRIADFDAWSVESEQSSY